MSDPWRYVPFRDIESFLIQASQEPCRLLAREA